MRLGEHVVQRGVSVELTWSRSNSVAVGAGRAIPQLDWAGGASEEIEAIAERR